jgi:uncharacterized protein
VACRTPRPKRDLLRIVRDPSGTVAIDMSARANGRGAYLCRDGACWQQAVRRRVLEHALKVTLPPSLVATLEGGPAAAGIEPNTQPVSTEARLEVDAAEPPEPTTQGGARGQK